MAQSEDCSCLCCKKLEWREIGIKISGGIMVDFEGQQWPCKVQQLLLHEGNDGILGGWVAVLCGHEQESIPLYTPLKVYRFFPPFHRRDHPALIPLQQVCSSIHLPHACIVSPHTYRNIPKCTSSGMDTKPLMRHAGGNLSYVLNKTLLPASAF